jgi:TolB protein
MTKLRARCLSGFVLLGLILLVQRATLIRFELVASGTKVQANLGLFQEQTRIGNMKRTGAVQYDAARQEYRITGGGDNIWDTTDAFQFLWRRVSGDLTLITAISWVGTGKQPHRKAGWMVRQGLEADAAYADAVVHGDRLISLQYRLVKGGPTLEIQSQIRAPAVLRLDRDGDLFTLSVSRKAGTFQPVGSITLALSDPVLAGLVVCSHDDSVEETATFTKVDLVNSGKAGSGERVVESSLETVTIETGERRLIYRARNHFEAPNWSRDGKFLLFNRGGRLYTLPVEGGTPKVLDTGSATECNNDHGFSYDGKWLAISHSPKEDSLIYVLPASGGTPRQVTKKGPSYWHGWSPDGTTLVYCAERNGEFDVYSIAVEGGEEKRLTMAPGLDDGPEYTPDGKFVYFNSERTGVMRLWRMRPDGTGQEQVTFDEEFADWFPHPSPDGKWLVLLSYDKSVQGHPENKDVTLRIMSLAGGKPRVLARLFGGQGTINVPSWSPNSRRIAFVSYRLVKK